MNTRWLGRQRRLPAYGIMALGLLTLGLIAVSPAAACLPQARLVTVLPLSSGPSGSHVRVEGVGFDPAPNTVDVRWNSSDGPALATATGPDFAVEVTIPEAPEGLYKIIVLSRSPDGAVGNAGSASFQVTGPAAETGGSSPATQGAPSPARSGLSGSTLVGFAVGGGIGLVLLGAFGGAYFARPRPRRH